MTPLNKPGFVTFLFLGGAKRVQMANLLSAAALRLGLKARFVSYELDRKCAIASVGPVVEGLRWNDPHILDDLGKVVREYEVDIVLPFVDPAVGVASRLCALPQMPFTPGAPEDMQEVLFDKVKAARIFQSHAFPIPATYSGESMGRQWIAKPRTGSASKGLIYLDAQQVSCFDNSAGEYLIQECIARREEISVDCYVSARTHEILTISPRKRLETAGGEVVRTLTIADNEIVSLSREILLGLQLTGPVTIQYIRDLASSRLMIMEINPRLGGGVTASIGAGACIPDHILHDALGIDSSPSFARPDVLVCRYLTDFIINPDD